MRSVRRFFAAYSADFWVFSALIAALTAFLRYSCAELTGITQTQRRDIRTLIVTLGVSSLIFVLLMHDNKRLKTSPLTWFSLRASRRFADSLSDLRRSNHQANILTLTALTVVFFINLFSRFISHQPAFVVAIDFGVITVTLAALLLTIRKGISNKLMYAVIAISIAMPVAMALLTGRLSSNRAPAAYVWLIAAILFSKFLSSRKISQFFFKLAVCVTLVGMIVELRYMSGADVAATIRFLIVILSVGFVVFSSLDFYISNSTANLVSLEKINRELRDTQEQLFRREQMATLGQLIAGVAHEINTPIGAIKASGEMMDGFDLCGIIKDAARFSEEDIEILSDIIAMSARSLKNMRSTIDLRRGKTQIRAYLKSVGLDDAEDIGNMLGSFEICDVEKVADNLDTFRRDNIIDILSFAQRIAPLLSSVQNIRFSTDKVTKIVFALKTFSHMNTTGGESEFDVIKNIDNVLVLYLNQLKRGIEVIRQYDEKVPLVYGNVEEIGQVWTNIVQNAIYAMSYVGTLTIRIRNLNGDKVEVSFTDTGTGILPENIDRIFDPFFTTKPLGEGSGIGMDICKKVIQKHNGEIRVESTWGQGTTFSVVLPAKPVRTSRLSSGTGVQP